MTSAAELSADVRETGSQTNSPTGRFGSTARRATDARAPLDGRYRYPATGATGAGVTAYIIDSGLWFSHTEFEGRVTDGAYIDFGDGWGPWDCNGHGTHVAGTVAGDHRTADHRTCDHGTADHGTAHHRTADHSAPPPPGFTSLTPARVLETRVGFATVDGRFAGGGMRAAGSTVELTVAGRAGVPADASAVMLNVTAVVPEAAGHFTVFPCGQRRPVASNVNYSAGQVVPNAVLAKVGVDGKVCIYTLAAAHIVVDANGYA